MDSNNVVHTHPTFLGTMEILKHPNGRHSYRIPDIGLHGDAIYLGEENAVLGAFYDYIKYIWEERRTHAK